jgi:hypothetical protein
MGNPTPTEFEQLRESFDGEDHFMGGSAVFGKAGSRHAERVANISVTDPWSWNDKQVCSLLQQVFPNFRTSETQRKRAGRWMYIIYRYFRMGFTANRIAMVLHEPTKRVEDTLRRIRKAAAGLRTTGKPRTHTKGRPKRQNPVSTYR